MNNFIERVISVRDWAHVVVKPDMMPYAMRSLTLRTTPLGNEEAKVLRQYRTSKTDNELYVPRGLVAHMAEPPERTWDSLLPLRSKIDSYREGQLETINTFLGNLERHKYGGILQAVTGAGKTVMAIDLAMKLGLRTLIIVPRTSLMKQWRERIKQYTTATDDVIGTVQGSKAEWDKPFVVAMIHTLAQKGYPTKFYYHFGTVIFDECHVIGAETFSRVAPMFDCRWRIGLTATPRRSDGMDPVFWWHLGPTIAKFTKLQAKARVKILPYRGGETSHSGCVWAGRLNLGRYYNRVANSRERMELILKVVMALHEKDHDILVLSERVQHLKNMRILLAKRGIALEKIGMCIGEEKQLDRKIILGTYGSAGMGVDIPRLSALVLATPRADIEQAVGRVLRQGAPIVVDIVDMSSSIMLGWARARRKFYRRITDDIVDRTVAA